MLIDVIFPVIFLLGVTFCINQTFVVRGAQAAFLRGAIKWCIVSHDIPWSLRPGTFLIKCLRSFKVPQFQFLLVSLLQLCAAKELDLIKFVAEASVGNVSTSNFPPGFFWCKYFVVCIYYQHE